MSDTASIRSWSTKHPRDAVTIRRFEEAGSAFLVTRNGEDIQRVFVLDPARGRETVGRNAERNTAVVDWDPEVSGSHCELELVGANWMVRDADSTNGTRLNHRQLLSRLRLNDGDILQVGRTVLLFRDCRPAGTVEETLVAAHQHQIVLTPRQRQVLLELARPRVLNQAALPSTNDAIATTLGIGVEAVKRNLTSLYEKFALPSRQPGKRVTLVQKALERRVITEADFG